MQERFRVIPSLDVAYLDNVSSAHEIIQQIQAGTCIRLGKDISNGDLLIEATNALPMEYDLVLKSIKEQREYALVSVGNQTEIIRGDKGCGIDPDKVVDALNRLGTKAKPGLFSHTHWNEELNPLPSLGGLGLGDVVYWDLFRSSYPGLECRIAVRTGGRTIAFKYHGHYVESK